MQSNSAETGWLIGDIIDEVVVISSSLDAKMYLLMSFDIAGCVPMTRNTSHFEMTSYKHYELQMEAYNATQQDVISMDCLRRIISRS
jgi:hypothetical protein